MSHVQVTDIRKRVGHNVIHLSSLLEQAAEWVSLLTAGTTHSSVLWTNPLCTAMMHILSESLCSWNDCSTMAWLS